MNPTQEKIISAATQVFLQKGMDGARMQEIADAAGINKALLHYYYRNKETLFSAVFSNALAELLPALIEIINSDIPLLEKIPKFLSVHMGFLQRNPLIPHFIISEAIRNPEVILAGFKGIREEDLYTKFCSDVNRSIDRGDIKPVDPKQLLVNILSLSIFPVIARPILQGFLNLPEESFNTFLENRKSEVAQFVVNSLK